MRNPKDYVWIQRWGKFQGSYDYYIREQQQRAAAENAPINAIYKSSPYAEQPNVWHTADDITNPDAQARFARMYPNDIPDAWTRKK